MKLLRQIPSIGPIRSALLMAFAANPAPFSYQRQLWGLQWFRSRDPRQRRSTASYAATGNATASGMTVRGLNDNHNRDLEEFLQKYCLSASTRPGPLRHFYLPRVETGMRPTMARLTLARKTAAISLTIWKKGVEFGPPTITSTSSLSISEEQAFPSLRFTPAGERGRAFL